MNDFIDVKLGFSNYINNISDLVYRFVNNEVLKKVLIFPLFIILLILEVCLFPVALVGAIAKWLISLIVYLTEDRTQFLYVLIVLFIELFALYYIMFVILLLLYKIFNLVSNGVGKANYEYNADEYVAMHTNSNFNEDKDDNKDDNKEKPKENIYVIDSEEYK